MLSSSEASTHFQKVFDLQEADLQEPGFQERRAPYENRFPINSAIAGIVAGTGDFYSSTITVDPLELKLFA